MKTVTGIIVGLLGYAAWTLSQPAAGEPGDLSSRVERLKAEWARATREGKVAGEARRSQLQQEFQAIFKK